MRLRSLLVSVLMLVAALFTVNAKATNYRYEYADVIREAEKPYTVHLKNEKKLYDLCIRYVKKFDFEDYPKILISHESYRKIPVSKFEDEFDIGFFRSLVTTQVFEVISKKILAEGYKTTDRAVNRFREDENYIYIPASKPIGDTLKVLVDKKSFSYTKDGKKYVFKNVGESVQSKLTISPVNNSIDLRYFTFLRATYNLSDNNCTIVAE